MVTESGGERTREVGWVQSAAMLVRREAAEQVGYLDPAFFVYSDETDFCKRLHDAGWRILHVPGRRGRPPRAAGDRPRPRASGGSSSFTAAATATCESTTAPRWRGRGALLAAWTYARAGAGGARSCRATSPASTGCTRARHFAPSRGEGLREAAAAYNAARSRRS